MGENTDTGLLREIDEELRQEHYAKLWKQYGKILIAAGVILVASVAGYKGWQAYDISQRSELAERFSSAVTAELNGDLARAYEAFSAIGEESGSGYGMLARFRAAAALSRQNDKAGAALIYNTLANDSGLDTQYRDIATLLGVMNEMDTADPGKTISRLAPLTADDSPWRFTARELSAVANLQSGNRQQAVDLYNQLIADATTPAGLRARAEEMLAAIGAP